MKNTTSEIIRVEPENPLATYLDLFLCETIGSLVDGDRTASKTVRLIIMSRDVSEYEIKICSGDDQGAIQTRSHEAIMEQIKATVDEYGYDSVPEFIAQSKILTAKAARRVASKAKKPKAPTSLPMAAGSESLGSPSPAEDSETKTAASEVKATTGKDRAAADKKQTADTVCDQCGNDFMKPERLDNHAKNMPNGLCKMTQPPARSDLNTYKTLADVITNPEVLKNIAEKKPIAVVVENGIITNMLGNTTASLIISKCRNCKQSGGCGASCRMAVQIYKFQAKLEIDGLADTPVMVWDALGDVICERTASGEAVPLKPNEAHYNCNTNNFSQIHNVSFNMRLRLSEYKNPRTDQTTISIHINQMTEN